MNKHIHIYIYRHIYVYIYIYAATVKDMREGCILALFLGSHFWALKSMFFSIFSDPETQFFRIPVSSIGVPRLHSGLLKRGCSEVVLRLFWGCFGVVLGLFWGCSGFEALVKHPETGHGPF